MQAVWYILIALMFTAYVVLDGFDFGAGVLHLFVARNDLERRTVLATIGPVWDGNEVWLIAGGGTLVFAFPRVYATGFSGFYLPLMMVLWLLILRGLSIEFRSQFVNPLWRALWDATFAMASGLIAVVLGAALGNVIRGVPIDQGGYFSAPLFTDFRPGVHPGVLDWYTVLVGAFSLIALAAHGSVYLAWKTEGPIHERAMQLAPRLWAAVAGLFVIVTVATFAVRGEMFVALRGRPWAVVFPLVVITAIVSVFRAVRSRQPLRAFLASAAFLAALLGATATALFPVILRSTIDARWTLTAFNASSSHHGLAVGLLWWIPAVTLAIGYFGFLFRSFRGKVSPGEDGH